MLTNARYGKLFIPIACLLCGIISLKKEATHQRFQKNKMVKWIVRLLPQNRASVYKPSWNGKKVRTEWSFSF
jgi:hypothetical protein